MLSIRLSHEGDVYTTEDECHANKVQQVEGVS